VCQRHISSRGGQEPQAENRGRQTEYPIFNKEYPMKKEKQYDLQDRLVAYAVRIIKLSESLPETKAGKHVFYRY
jgi:hypothetical protein